MATYLGCQSAKDWVLSPKTQALGG